MFRPVFELQANFQYRTGTGFEVLLANSHGSMQYCNTFFSADPADGVLCVHQWVEAVVGVDTKQEAGTVAQAQ